MKISTLCWWIIIIIAILLAIVAAPFTLIARVLTNIVWAMINHCGNDDSEMGAFLKAEFNMPENEYDFRLAAMRLKHGRK